MIFGLAGRNLEALITVAKVFEKRNFYKLEMTDDVLDNTIRGENYVILPITKEEDALELYKKDEFILAEVVTNNKNTEPLEQGLKSLTKIELNADYTRENLDTLVRNEVKKWMYTLQPKRPSWDKYFLNIAEMVKTRSNCMSPPKGAVIVRDKQILSTGYNGTPKGITHCMDGGCPRCTARHLGELESGKYDLVCICSHAEENAIAQAADQGTKTRGATMYVTHAPCHACARKIINSGIIEVIARQGYPDKIGLNLLKEANVQFKIYKE